MIAWGEGREKCGGWRSECRVLEMLLKTHLVSENPLNPFGFLARATSFSSLL
jgi:hypothetical protein